MNTQEQAYTEGFVKRASEYGFSEAEAIALLKQAAPQGFNIANIKDIKQSLDNAMPTLGGLPSPIHGLISRAGAVGTAGLQGLGNAAGNFVANHPKLEQGLQNYSNNYNTAMDATRVKPTIMDPVLRPGLRPIAAHLAAGAEAIHPTN